MCGVANETEARSKVPAGFGLRGKFKLELLDDVLQVSKDCIRC